jgi:AcrR family transcriptional regulator
MARPRIIDLDRVLDAGERVVMREGASNLTLDAVAAEAGISKGSVVYDCKNKHDLIKAIVERKLAAEERKVEEAVQELGDQKNAAIRGRIAAASAMVRQESGAVALQLCSAVAQDGDLHALMKQNFGRTISAVETSSENPRVALLALLALQGLCFMHVMDFHTWSDAELGQLLDEIEALVKVPEPATPPDS